MHSIDALSFEPYHVFVGRSGRFRYSMRKDKELKETRGISFHDVISAIREERPPVVRQNPSRRHHDQMMFIVELRGIEWWVPFVIDRHERFFLKTIIPRGRVSKED